MHSTFVAGLVVAGTLLAADWRESALNQAFLTSAVTGRIPTAIRALEPLLANHAVSGEVERPGNVTLRTRKGYEGG